MPTPCQLRFVRPDDSTPIAQFSKRLDGHPAAIVYQLVRLTDLLNATDCLRGPGQTAAQFLFLTALDTMALYVPACGDRPHPAPAQTMIVTKYRDVIDPDRIADLDRPAFLLDHGIEDPARGIHGDEEYLYIVEVPPGSATDIDAWTVRVSEHEGFPTGDGRSHEAFQRACWAFEGSLPEAFERFVEP